jgi:hypothetical protein
VKNPLDRLRSTARRSAAQPAPAPLLAYACPRCSSDAVAWTASDLEGPEHARVHARCGACGMAREIVMTRAIAARFLDHMATGQAAIRRAVEQLERGHDVERLAAVLLGGGSRPHPAG